MNSNLASIFMAAALFSSATLATSPIGTHTPTSQGAAASYTAERLQSAEQSRQYWQQLDRNQDHSISRTEAAKVPDLIAQWHYLDLDHNGRLDRAEFTAYETY